ncbi:MAG: NAD(P)-binding protein [Bradyrhizobium sp.]|nr:NAD(P)-binding protein [Bradyrhizobium sp.]
MGARKPIEVAVIGGGCASMAAAFELSHPRHKGKYHVTVYQVGWRLGGKGSSGRGVAGRIEEHGLHVWLGCYDNAFMLLRQCYEELRMRSNEPVQHWDEVFMPDCHIAVAGDSAKGGWVNWTAHFPPAAGLPGDPVDTNNPFAMTHYFSCGVALLRTLLLGLETFRCSDEADSAPVQETAQQSPDAIAARIANLLRFGALASAAVAVEALALVEAAIKSIAAVPQSALLRLMEAVAAAVREQLERIVATDDHLRYQWEIIDLILANLVGAVRFGLLTDPRGLDAINHLDQREWLRINGASERAINSSFTRVLYDMALAYEDGDENRPAIAAGVALRGTLRFFFNYRGAPLWKMRAGMGDVVFAPFYRVLRQRGVTFRFFHRLRNVRLAEPAKLRRGEKPYVEALEFDVQAEIVAQREYQPLIDIRGMKCWPSLPDFRQLNNGQRLRRQRIDFESHWDTRKVATRKLLVTRDFDCVVLGVGAGAVPYVCSEIVASNPRWRDMVGRVKTVATQAFQVWLDADLQELGWELPPVTLTSFVKPFDTWADMGHVVPAEDWRQHPPQTVAYFCNVLADPPSEPAASDRDYPQRRNAEVRLNAINFLNRDIRNLWPRANRPSGEFRWELLVDPKAKKSKATASRFDTQFWTANVNPSDRYVLSLPGSLDHRISPLDNTYDNLTIAGDWTECSLNVGCVEAAMISGRLAAHAISGWPALEDIIGFDHP